MRVTRTGRVVGMVFAGGDIITAAIQLGEGRHELLEFQTFTLPDYKRGIAEDLRSCTAGVEAYIDLHRKNGLIGVGFKESEPLGVQQKGLDAKGYRRLYLQGATLQLLTDRGVPVKTYLKMNLFKGFGLSMPKKGMDELENTRKDPQRTEQLLGIQAGKAYGKDRFMALAVAMLAAEQL